MHKAVRSSGLSLERLRIIASRLVRKVDFSSMDRETIMKTLADNGVTEARFREVRTTVSMRKGWL